jgi:protein-S-isoprenylcysteine O-methyltransferase Ste14
MKQITIIELAILLLMILVKAIILHQNGIKAMRLGKPDKNALALMIIIACFVYAALSGVLNLPFPAITGKPFWNSKILNIIAIPICTISLIWFGITLKTFGNSFRIGIDEKTNNQLITDGTFALSRNPVFLAFIVFFLGIFLTYSNLATMVFFVLLVIMVHRQILNEENFLKKHYGKEYEEYCKKVRRYI